MSEVNKPPFRADHVGSLLRPPELLKAREQREKGIISGEDLRLVEDRCIRAVVKMQEDIGLHGITDGEYRRTLWHADFLSRIEGVVVNEGVVPGAGRDFQGAMTCSVRQHDLKPPANYAGRVAWKWIILNFLNQWSDKSRSSRFLRLRCCIFAVGAAPSISRPILIWLTSLRI